VVLVVLLEAKLVVLAVQDLLVAQVLVALAAAVAQQVLA
jgi:hypothetical protein